MGKKKVSVIAVAILTCIVCVSIIAGATFALFTDNDKVNVSVTTATLDVNAEIADVVGIPMGEKEDDNHLFAEYDSDTKLLTVDNMLPGDVVSFKVTITSAATVDVKYRVNFGCVENDNGLFEQLLLGVKDSVEAEYQYYVSSVSAWDEIKYNKEDASKMVVTKYVVIELPAYVTDEWQDADCNIEFAVEAVQANASGEKYETAEKSVKALRVKDTDLTDNVIGDDIIGLLQDEGDCIVLDSTSVHDWTIDTDLAKKFGVRGCDVNTITVDAPNASINYYVNKTQIVNVDRTAPQSFHVYGVVAQSLTLKEGRAVVEKGAQVASAVVAPELGAEAEIIANASVANLSVEGEGKVNVEVAEEVVVKNLVVNNTDTAIKNEGTVESVKGDNVEVFSREVTTVDELVRALAVGGKVVLAEKIVANDVVTVPENTTVVLDLNGHKFVSMYQGRGFVNQGNLTIDDSSNGKGMFYNDSCVLGEVEKLEFATNAVTNDPTGVLVINGGRFGDNDYDDDNKNSSTWGAAVRNLGVATINGGYFTCEDNHGGFFSYAIRSEGTLTINGGKVYGNMNGGVAADAGTLTINGGEFYCVKSNNWHVVVTGSKAKVLIKGGKFEAGSNSYNNLLGGFSGMPSWDASGALEVNGYTIADGEFIAHVKTAAQLTNALGTPANLPNYTIVLDDKIVSTSSVAINSNLTLNLNGNELESSASSAITVSDVNVLIENGTITNTAQRQGTTVLPAAIKADANSNITLKDVNVVGTTYGIYSKGSVTVKGGTIKITDATYGIGLRMLPETLVYEEPTQINSLVINGTVIDSARHGLEIRTLNANINGLQVTAGQAAVGVYRDATIVMTDCVLNGAWYGIAGNGTTKKTDNNCGINTDITLNNCTVTSTYVGIYHPQVGVLTINGGSVTGGSKGDSAIEVRAGTVVIDGATLKCESASFSATPSGSATTITGAALAVSQHNTDQEINVTVKNSTLKGVYALYEKDLQNETARDKIHITLEGENTLTGGVYSQNCSDITAVDPE